MRRRLCRAVVPRRVCQIPEILAHPINLPPAGASDVGLPQIDPANPSPPVLAGHRAAGTAQAMAMQMPSMQGQGEIPPPQVTLAPRQHPGVLPAVGHSSLIAGPPPQQYQHPAQYRHDTMPQPQQQQQQYDMQPVGGAHLDMAHHQDQQVQQNPEQQQAYQQAYELPQYQQHDYELQTYQRQPDYTKEGIAAPRPPTVAG